MAGNGKNGTLTAALQLTRPGRMVNSAEQATILAAAAALLAGTVNGNGLSAAQQRALERFRNCDYVRPDDRDLLVDMQDSGMFTEGERRVIECAMRWTSWGMAPEPEPPPDPKHEAKIAEAAAAREALGMAHDVALDRVILLDDQLRKAQKQADIDRLREEVKTAREDYRTAREAVERAQGRLMTLMVQRDNLKRQWMLERSIKA